MDKIEQFIDLFVEVWRDGISGINISEIVIAILIFFAFLLLRGFFAKFIIKRLEKYVSKTTNRFDNSLVQSLKGPTKFFPIVIGFFIATSYVSLGDSTENFVGPFNDSTKELSKRFVVLETYFSRRFIINFANRPLSKRKAKNIRRAIIISEILIPDIPFFQTSTNKLINCSILSIFNLIYFYQFLARIKNFSFFPTF